MARDEFTPTVTNLRRAIWFRLKEQSFEPIVLDLLPGLLFGFMGFQHTAHQILEQFDEAALGARWDPPGNWEISDWSGEHVLDWAEKEALPRTPDVLEWDEPSSEYRLRSGAHHRTGLYLVAVIPDGAF
jgi:hypothetical protein